MLLFWRYREGGGWSQGEGKGVKTEEERPEEKVVERRNLEHGWRTWRGRRENLISVRKDVIKKERKNRMKVRKTRRED